MPYYYANTLPQTVSDVLQLSLA